MYTVYCSYCNKYALFMHIILLIIIHCKCVYITHIHKINIFTCILPHMYIYIHVCVDVQLCCLLVRSCCLTQRYMYQSKSLNEISLYPMAPRDRQSTLRFEKSILAVWKNKSWCQTKVVGTSELRESDMTDDNHCNIDKSSFEKQIFYTIINGAWFTLGKSRGLNSTKGK